MPSSSSSVFVDARGLLTSLRLGTSDRFETAWWLIEADTSWREVGQRFAAPGQTVCRVSDRFAVLSLLTSYRIFFSRITRMRSPRERGTLPLHVHDEDLEDMRESGDTADAGFIYSGPALSAAQATFILIVEVRRQRPRSRGVRDAPSLPGGAQVLMLIFAVLVCLKGDGHTDVSYGLVFLPVRRLRARARPGPDRSAATHVPADGRLPPPARTAGAPHPPDRLHRRRGRRPRHGSVAQAGEGRRPRSLRGRGALTRLAVRSPVPSLPSCGSSRTGCCSSLCSRCR